MWAIQFGSAPSRPLVESAAKTDPVRAARFLGELCRNCKHEEDFSIRHRTCHIMFQAGSTRTASVFYFYFYFIYFFFLLFRAPAQIPFGTARMDWHKDSNSLSSS